MQFIVRPNNQYQFISLPRYLRPFLYLFAFFAFFTSGLMVGLTWMWDGKSPSCIPELIPNGAINNDGKQDRHALSGEVSAQPIVGTQDPHQKQSQSLSDLSKKQTFLIAIVMSAANNRARRDAIRDTWAQLGKGREVKIFFTIGTMELDDKMHQSLREENSKYNDILQLSEAKDAYSGLTERLLVAIKWSVAHYDFKYILKVDDDSFVSLDKLFDELAARKVHTHLYWGYFDGRASVKRRGQWTESKWFLCDLYLPYALGGGYVISSDLAKYLHDNAHLLQLYNSEDTSLGVWLAPLSIERLHDTRFDTEYRSRGCSNKFLISHKQSEEDMKSKYHNLVTTGQLCSRQSLVRPSYEYNWKEKPSKCCIRDPKTVNT